MLKDCLGHVRLTVASAALGLMAAGGVGAQALSANVPLILFDVVPNFLKYSPTMNLGEVLGVLLDPGQQVLVDVSAADAALGRLREQDVLDELRAVAIRLQRRLLA